MTRLERLRWIAQWMDSRFSLFGGKIRFGLDAIIGLVPGVGDFIGSLVGIFTLFEAMQLGVSRVVLLRMSWNIFFETLLGSIPFAGDIFDVFWKANVRNLALVEADLRNPTNSRRRAYMSLILIAILLLLSTAAVVGLGVWILRWIFLKL